MPGKVSSLLAGRNKAPLTQQEALRVSRTFIHFDERANARYEPGARTVFHVSQDENGNDVGEIVFGPDIFPGQSVIDPNSALSIDAAVAHELTHFYRWRDKMELDEEELTHIDEALTSLQAISRYGSKLNTTDHIQLVGDAIQRICLFLDDYRQRHMSVGSEEKGSEDDT